MKVAIVTTHFPPIKSGVARVVSEEINYMKKKYKIDFEVFCYQPYNAKSEEILNGIKVKRFKPLARIRNYLILKGMLKSLLKSDANIIHAHDYGWYPATSSFICSKIKNLPFVFTPHLHPPIFSSFRTFLFYVYTISQGYFILRHANKVIALTKHEKNLIYHYSKYEKNIEIIPNPIDTKKFRKIKVEKPNFLNENIVLFIGRMLPNWKGVEHLFQTSKEILKERKDISFIFIGKGPLKEIYEKEARKFQKNYLFLDEVNERELIKWYNLANVFVLPSKYEAFGMVLAEAQSCCVPCISTNVGGIPEVVINGKTGFLVNYGDVKDLKEKILYLIDNPKIAKKMGLNGRKHVIKNFDIKIVCKKLFKLYKSLI